MKPSPGYGPQYALEGFDPSADAAWSSEECFATEADGIYRIIGRRLLPLLFCCYVAAYLDRVNVGFAKTQMQAALHFDESVYGLGAGIFFLGYFLFEVPSSLVLHRVGARRWIATIMVCWGLLSMATLSVSTPAGFYTLRFLLGVAEAGFFPGVLLHLTEWFPASRRGMALSRFLAAVPLAGIVGAPSSGWILRHLDGAAGRAGWQWLFLLQALPSVLLGLVVWWRLDDRVVSAHWLTHRQRRRVIADIVLDTFGKTDGGLRQALAVPQVWLLAAAYFGLACGLYCLSFWLPGLLHGAGIHDAWRAGLLGAVPWLGGLLAMLMIAGRAPVRFTHEAACRRCAAWILLGAGGLAFSAVFHADAVPALAGLTVGAIGVLAALPVFWSLPMGLLRGGAAAAGIAMVNSFGNLAGFVSPFMIGLLQERTHGLGAGVYLCAAAMAAGALLVLGVRRRPA